jgi:hypothetical protein
MMREVSRPVRRKEIGDVLLCSNAPISYPTSGVEREGVKASPDWLLCFSAMYHYTKIR